MIKKVIVCDFCKAEVDENFTIPNESGEIHVCFDCIKDHYNQIAADGKLINPSDLDDAAYSITEGQRKAIFAIGRKIGLHKKMELYEFLRIDSIRILSEREADACISKLLAEQALFEIANDMEE